MIGTHQFIYRPIHYHFGAAELELTGPEGHKMIKGPDAGRIHTDIMSRVEGEERVAFIKSIYESIRNNS